MVKKKEKTAEKNINENEIVTLANLHALVNADEFYKVALTVYLYWLSANISKKDYDEHATELAEAKLGERLGK